MKVKVESPAERELSEATKGSTSNIELLGVNQLEVDAHVQRSNPSELKIRDIVANFDADALGIITVSARTGGQYVILDGQHRWEAVRRLTDNEGSVECRVFRGLRLEQEARIFLLLNNGNHPNLFDQYRVGVTGDDPEYTAIDKIVHHHGLAVASGNTSGNISAIKVIRKLYRMETPAVFDGMENVSVLHLTLGVIVDAWGTQTWGLQGSCIEAVGRLIHKYGGRIELDRLIVTLRDFDGGPGDLLARSRGLAGLRKVRVWHAMVDLIIEAYNKNLPTQSPRRLSLFSGG